ncbi:MAG: amino acid ABC transporter ATP-binding protein [Kineosporiaceae bacterium]
MSRRPGGPTVLRAENVVKLYGAHAVLRGIDLEVAEGEVVALVGASGSGKSTLLRCLCLLEPVSDGQVLLDGDDITDPRARADRVRSRFGVVFQAFNLFPHLSVMENICLAPRLVHGRARADAHARASELLARIGLADKADAYPDRLSGGQQQRVAIVRAVATDPRVLLLDEVTSALDPTLVAEVLGLVRELAGQGRTIVMATHELGFARQVADRVCMLSEGTIIEQGPPSQVLGEPLDPRTRAFLGRVHESGRI